MLFLLVFPLLLHLFRGLLSSLAYQGADWRLVLAGSCIYAEFSLAKQRYPGTGPLVPNLHESGFGLRELKGLEPPLQRDQTKSLQEVFMWIGSDSQDLPIQRRGAQKDLRNPSRRALHSKRPAPA